MEIHHQKPHEIKVRQDQFLGLEPELLILHEILIDQDRYLRVIKVTNWAVQIYYLKIFHPIHKLDIPVCRYF